jgi:hypothetical protein
MKQLKFVQACPDDAYYVWQTHVWLESLRNIGHSEKAICLIFTPNFREFNTKWKELEVLYPEVEWFYQKDENNIGRLFHLYIPILRPYILMKYFEAHPERTNDAIFYCDCDIVFTERFNIDAYINDDVCYLSDTNSYINAKYFDSKVKDVLPDKLEEYKKIDVLDNTAKIVGIDRATCEKYNEHSGGAQYLLKNIDSKFWEKMIGDTINIRTYLQSINRQFFESENKGYQSWCADMWAILMGLWYRKYETKVIPEMEFSWSSDHIGRIERTGILHNAGIVGNTQGDIPTFYKGNYHSGKDPFEDPYLIHVFNDEKSKTLCNHYYVSQMLKVKQKYNLKYH